MLNRLAACVSCVRAAATGDYIKKSLDHVRVRIEPVELQRFADAYDAFYAYVDERIAGQGAGVARVTTEQLTAAPERALRRVHEALGVRHEPPVASVVKDVPRQTWSPLCAAIVNFHELRQAFVGTDLEADFRS